MSKELAPRSFESGGLSIRVDAQFGKLKLTWGGQSVARDPSAVLNPFFESLSRYGSKTRDLDLDFRSLEYMNSSTLKPILTFVQAASSAYRSVGVRYDSQKSWQRLSFKLLQALAGSWQNVKIEG
jgi:hypothetical protein